MAFLYPNSERRLYASDERLTAHGAGRKRFAVSHGCKTAPGRRCRLIRAHCSFYDNGNCLYLDDGEEVVCPQITSFSVICAFFRQVVLKDETARGLEAKLFRRETAKRCRVCGRTFSSTSNNAKYCPDCRAAMQRRQKAAYARRRRANVEKSAYEKA